MSHATSEPILRGARVMLRVLAEDDPPRVLAILLQPGVSEWWPGYDMARLHADTLEDAAITSLAVELDGALVGLVLVTEQAGPYYKAAGIDIALDTTCVGHGLGGDTVRTVARYLFEERGHHRLTTLSANILGD